MAHRENAALRHGHRGKTRAHFFRQTTFPKSGESGRRSLEVPFASGPRHCGQSAARPRSAAAKMPVKITARPRPPRRAVPTFALFVMATVVLNPNSEVGTGQPRMNPAGNEGADRWTFFPLRETNAPATTLLRRRPPHYNREKLCTAGGKLSWQRTPKPARLWLRRQPRWVHPCSSVVQPRSSG